MTFGTLADAAIINPRGPARTEVPPEEMCDFVPMAAVREDGSIGAVDARPYSEVMKGYTAFQDGDVLLAKITPCFENNKIALARTRSRFAFGSTEFHVVRPKVGVLDSKYLAYFLRQDRIRFLGERRMTGSAGQRRVPKSFVAELDVPLPPLKEQRRIAAILDKVDAIRRKREQSLELADDLLMSTFLNMFGDPVSNPMSLDQKPLAKCAAFTSGATPSKANIKYWTGEFPWVSPKDMKIDVIADAQDHVSEIVFEQTNLKKIPLNTVLIVVRGMILAHTVPLAITGGEVAINQDIKAITFEEGIDPIFGFYCLKVQHNEILSRVSTAAHGTKRLDIENLGEILISLPRGNSQKKFVSIVNKFGEMRNGLVNDLRQVNDCFASLSQHAFRGDL